jgi:membrane fusion protein, multidrug efflux system
MLKADAFPDRPLEARVSSITPMGNPELKTYRVRLALPADTPLFIGMSVDVNIIVRTVADAVLVPAPALIGGAVQAVGQDNRIDLRPVETGIRGAERVQITAGIDVGERVVSPALDGLKQGARVRPATPPGSRASAAEHPAP